MIGGQLPFFLLDFPCGIGDFLNFGLGQYWARFGSSGCWLDH